MNPSDRSTRRWAWLLALPALVFLAVPIIGMVQRMPWSEVTDTLSSDAVLEALRLTLIVTPTATVAALLLGVPLGWLLSRPGLRGATLLRALALLPMVLPPVVGGTALLFALGRTGLIGQWLDRWFGITLPFTTAGAVIAATYVAVPFVVLTIEGGFRSVDPRLEETASSFGAGPLTAFRTVTLPLIGPSLRAAATLAAARALGEFGATIAFAGNSPGRTRTLPLSVFFALEDDPGTALVISLLLVAISLLILVSLRGRWWPR